ncbi:hypothetical protein B0T17DRAFT_177250 [Bombardia bombarda]|uniref:Uncharacterized protein n=1 Tax=Bombardia bombarda TaxID=252184 RepID=A0AA40C8P9_9PEZI|nr:hypothetical protein B0T17DRAFT_177250 [Bombardia bombarda]
MHLWLVGTLGLYSAVRSTHRSTGQVPRTRAKEVPYFVLTYLGTSGLWFPYLIVKATKCIFVKLLIYSYNTSYLTKLHV